MVEIYGSSDDLIEVEGDISEEFQYLNDADGDLLAFSDGTVLRIHYSEQGVWRISLVASGEATVAITSAPENDENDYSDRAKLDGVFDWVVHGTDVATA